MPEALTSRGGVGPLSTTCAVSADKERAPQHSAAMSFVIPESAAGACRVALVDLADRQLAVARRAQLEQLGLTNGQIDRMLTSGRWRTDADGLVVVLHNGPLTAPQQETVAVLAGGKLCGLAARTAAARGGLQGWPAHKIEVLVPRGTTYPELHLVDVKVHESRRFTAEDLHPTAWPPSVRMERALVDGAAWSARPRTACGFLAAGVQQRLTEPSRLLETLEQAGQIRFKRLLRSALVDIEGGAQAVSEMDFTRFCRRNRLPEPQRQVVRRDRDGRRRYLDAVLVGPTGRVVRVEIDGALHLVVQTYWDDMYRDNEASIARETQLRFPSFAIHADDRKALEQLRRALDLSGPEAQDAA